MKKNNPFFKVHNLSYKNILNDVSFELKENSFNILVGANGCGKTTLVKCLGGLLDYNGSILLDNYEIPNEKRDIFIKKDIAIVKDCDFLFDSDVLQNLMFPLLNLGYSELEAKNKIYKTTEELDMGYVLTKKVKILSNQEKKMFCFLRAVIQDYKILIIDDIFDGISNSYKTKIFDYLKKLKNKTILFLTHNEEYIINANSNKDSVIIMKSGKIKIQEKFQEIIKEEKKFIKNKLTLPFEVDLAHKLKIYNLLEDITIDIDEMVNEIWE